MGTVERPGTETLSLARCPVCDGDVEVWDCGYSSFNPGTARCNGNCGREWSLGYVDDEWDAGKTWNQRAATIKHKLSALTLLRVNKPLSVSRDFAREALEEEAATLVEEMRTQIIGASKEVDDASMATD